ncbi:ketoacyl-ACP synthase III family protein [Nocardiopsis sp. CNR-923]|uniref:ketoacyl-ACP synthase III family protein n=1 Tax=Nocardiopsis sp. CNR-923 TaxID=1904965 RepID=UPI0021CD0C60|nr:ketoacyl-ACP synthase III family protein [Nocardiopsis sp. CNR-923]
MRYARMYVAGTGRWLPPTVRVEDAVRDGRCRSSDVWRTGIESVCVSEDASGPEMAARAAREALARAGVDHADLVLHASTYHQGHDMWAPASYVQRAALGEGGSPGSGAAGDIPHRSVPGGSVLPARGSGPRGHAGSGTGPERVGRTADGSGGRGTAEHGPAFEVRQLSNGGLAALELAAGYLSAGGGRSTALLTTGDRFCPPGFDRWVTDPGTIYGDGGTALVLSNRRGFARLISLVTASDPGLEGMQRGRRPFGAAPLEHGTPVDVDAARRGFVADHGLDAVLERIDAGQEAALDRALSEADLKIEDVARFVLPNLGLARMRAHFLHRFEIDPERTTWEWGRRIGHLGAGDQFAGLHHLVASGGLLPGERCVLVGVGAGFTWSVAVVELLHRPEGGRGR